MYLEQNCASPARTLFPYIFHVLRLNLYFIQTRRCIIPLYYTRSLKELAQTMCMSIKAININPLGEGGVGGRPVLWGLGMVQKVAYNTKLTR